MQADDLTLRLIPRRVVLSITGIGSTSLYKLISIGEFPRPVRVGRSSRWVQTEVYEWVNETIKSSKQKESLYG